MLFDRKAMFGRRFAGKDGQQAMRAKGRERKPGQQNLLEKKFELALHAAIATEEIAWFGYDVIKLRLGDNTFLSPDFFVMAHLPTLLGIDVGASPGEIIAIDTKGGLIEEDAKVKMRVAVSHLPFRLFYAQARPKKDGGGWKLTEV